MLAAIGVLPQTTSRDVVNAPKFSQERFPREAEQGTRLAGVYDQLLSDTLNCALHNGDAL